MNKVRFIALLLIAAGIGARFLFENSGFSFFFALVTGVGIGLMLTGRFGKYGRRA